MLPTASPARVSPLSCPQRRLFSLASSFASASASPGPVKLPPPALLSFSNPSSTQLLPAAIDCQRHRSQIQLSSTWGRSIMLPLDPSSAPTPPTTTTPSDSRLYVGNLSPAVDEFALVALFSKFGKISKLDFLFHKSGVLRGKPRGYAFIEMNRRDEALKAMIELNNKPVRGKRILVTPANESQYQAHQAANQNKPNHSQQTNSSHPGRAGQRGRPASSDPMRPTTLSILKSQQQPKGVNNRIAALEAKLASMQQGTGSTTTASSSPDSHLASTSSLLSSKPSFLPENPNIFRTGQGHKAQQSTRLSDSTLTLSNNAATIKSSKISSTYTGLKNPSGLDAIGLTLKEQLKRNRELQSLMPKTNKSSAPCNPQINDNQAKLPGSTASQTKNPMLPPLPPASSKSTSPNDPSLNKSDQDLEASCKRQKLDHGSASQQLLQN